MSNDAVAPAVRSESRGDVALILIDNPPVNALSAGVPEGLARAFDELARDPDVRAAVLIGAGRGGCAQQGCIDDVSARQAEAHPIWADGFQGA